MSDLKPRAAARLDGAILVVTLLGLLRWVSLLVALPWAVMVGLTVREGMRTTRRRRTVSVSST